MLALAWPFSDDARIKLGTISARLSASLCAGIGGQAATWSNGSVHCAYRGLAWTAAQSKAWRPAQLADGKVAIFHGYFDNAEVLAAELGVEPSDRAILYARAVEAWGDDADPKIIGDYCSVIADPSNYRLRLARTPFRAPPLYHYQDREMSVVGSVPRIFFAAGVRQQLNETRVADSGMINFLDQEASWFENIHRVPLGTIVELRRGQARLLKRYYDPLAIPEVEIGSDAECIGRVSELLDEA